MALRDQPYLPLYIQDIMTDEKLNECCASTHGIFIKGIMCLMHKSDSYGRILLKQKHQQCDSISAGFAQQLIRHLPYSESEICEAIAELLHEKVLYFEDNYLCQKRMIKDYEISVKRSEAGKRRKANAPITQVVDDSARELSKSRVRDIFTKSNDPKESEVKRKITVIPRGVEAPKMQRTETINEANDIELTPPPVKTIHPMAKLVAAKFHIREELNHTAYRAINSFVHTLTDDEVKYMGKQLEYYFKHREITGQSQCNWMSWIGAMGNESKWDTSDYESLFLTEKSRKDFDKKNNSTPKETLRNR